MSGRPPDAPVGALAGRRVVVTRAADQAGGLEAMLAELGAQVVTVPMIEMVPAPDGGAGLAAALRAIGSYDWIVVTSPNAAACVADALGRYRGRVAAVGGATAAVLARVDLRPPRQSAAGLLEVFPAGPGRVLLPQSAQAHRTLSEGLRALGWFVDVVTAYDVVGRELTETQRLAATGGDAVLFASGTAARAWVAALGTDASGLVVAIGPQTADVARELGLKVDLVASDHSPAGLVATLVAHWNRP